MKKEIKKLLNSPIKFIAIPFKATNKDWQTITFNKDYPDDLINLAKYLKKLGKYFKKNLK